MKKVLTFFIPFIITTMSQAQSLTPAVVASQGTFSESKQISLQWTMGESFVETTPYHSILFTEGFNQPFMYNGDSFSKGNSTNNRTSNSSNSIFESLELDIYPNPFQNYLQLSVSGTFVNTLEIRLVDVNGMIIKKGVLTPEKPSSTLTADKLPAAVYLIHIIDESTKQSAIFRVLKLY